MNNMSNMNNMCNMNNMSIMNNMCNMNNMSNMNNHNLVQRNNFNNYNGFNWFGNNFNYNNNFMNTPNNFYFMQMFQNQMMKRHYFQMMYQQNLICQMYKIILMKKRRQKIIALLADNNNNNNNNNLNINQNNDIIENNFVPNQALLDVAYEPNPPQQQDAQNNIIINNELVTEIIIDVMNLNPDLLNGFGNNIEGKWAQGEMRGGKPYIPPNGWIGYGLNVLNKYDNGNNDWLACNGRQGEWCIAYHGACHGQSSDDVKKNIKAILETNLRPGGGQAYKDYNDDNHPGNKVGVGVYCTPNPSVIEGYAGVMNVEGHNYKVAFMLRVKPDKIRFSNSQKDYWVVNGDFSELRPYRLLIKPIS